MNTQEKEKNTYNSTEECKSILNSLLGLATGIVEREIETCKKISSELQTACKAATAAEAIDGSIYFAKSDIASAFDELNKAISFLHSAHYFLTADREVEL